MGGLVIAGVVCTIFGLAILAWCIFRVVRAKRANLNDDDMQALVQSAVVWNLGAMALSGLGLTILIVGLVL